MLPNTSSSRSLSGSGSGPGTPPRDASPVPSSPQTDVTVAPDRSTPVPARASTPTARRSTNLRDARRSVSIVDPKSPLPIDLRKLSAIHAKNLARTSSEFDSGRLHREPMRERQPKNLPRSRSEHDSRTIGRRLRSNRLSRPITDSQSDLGAFPSPISPQRITTRRPRNLSVTLGNERDSDKRLSRVVLIKKSVKTLFDLDDFVKGYSGTPEHQAKLAAAKRCIDIETARKHPRFTQRIDEHGRASWVRATTAKTDPQTGEEKRELIKSNREKNNEAWARREKKIARARSTVSNSGVARKVVGRRAKGQSFGKVKEDTMQVIANNPSQSYSYAGWAGTGFMRSADGGMTAGAEIATPLGEIGGFLATGPIALDSWASMVGTAKSKDALRAVRDQVILNMQGWERFIAGSKDPLDRAAFRAFEIAINLDPVYSADAQEADRRTDLAFGRDGLTQPVGGVVSLAATSMAVASVPGGSVLAVPTAVATAYFDIEQGKSEAAFHLKNYRTKKANIEKFSADIHALDDGRHRCIVGGYVRAQTKARNLSRHESNFGISRKLKGYGNTVAGTVGNLGLGAATILAATGVAVTAVAWPVVVGVLAATVVLPSAAYYTGNAVKFGLRRVHGHAVKRSQRDVAMVVRQRTSAALNWAIRKSGGGDGALTAQVNCYRGEFKTSNRKPFASMHLGSIDLERNGHFALHLLAQDIERYLDTGDARYFAFAQQTLEKAGMSRMNLALLVEDAVKLEPGRQRTALIKSAIAPTLGVSFTTAQGLEPLPHVSFYMGRVFEALPAMMIAANNLTEQLGATGAPPDQVQTLQQLAKQAQWTLRKLGELPTPVDAKTASALTPTHADQKEFLAQFSKALYHLKLLHTETVKLLGQPGQADPDAYFFYSLLEALSHSTDRSFVREFLEVMEPFEAYVNSEVNGLVDPGTTLCCDLYRFMSRNPAMMERLWGAEDAEAFAEGDWESMYDPGQCQRIGQSDDKAVVTDGGDAKDANGRAAPMSWLMPGPYASTLAGQAAALGTPGANSPASGGLIRHAIEVWTTDFSNPHRPAHLKQHAGKNLCSLHCLNMLMHDVTGRWDYMIPDQAVHAAAFRHTHGYADVRHSGVSFGELLTWTVDDPDFGASAALAGAFSSCGAAGGGAPGAASHYRTNDASGTDISVALAEADSAGLTFNMPANPVGDGSELDGSKPTAAASVSHSVVIRRAAPGSAAPFLMYDPMVSLPIEVRPAGGSNDMRDAIAEVMRRYGVPGDNSHEVCLPTVLPDRSMFKDTAQMHNMRSVPIDVRAPLPLPTVPAPTTTDDPAPRLDAGTTGRDLSDASLGGPVTTRVFDDELEPMPRTDGTAPLPYNVKTPRPGALVPPLVEDEDKPFVG